MNRQKTPQNEVFFHLKNYQIDECGRKKIYFSFLFSLAHWDTLNGIRLYPQRPIQSLFI